MQKTKIIGMAIAATLGVVAFAAELAHVQVPSAKEPLQLVVVYSGKEVIAELKVIKPGTLDLEAGDIRWHLVAGNRTDYSCTGGSKLELLAEGKSVLKVSADRMLIPSADQNFKIKGPN